MKKCNVQAVRCESASALGAVQQEGAPGEYAAYVGLDVHKETIAVAVACSGREAPQGWGEVANRPKAVAKLVQRLSQAFGGELLLFGYEAGPCGYALHRQLLELGQECQVVAPSLIPHKPGERISPPLETASSPLPRGAVLAHSCATVGSNPRQRAVSR